MYDISCTIDARINAISLYVLHLHNYAVANRECDNGQLHTNSTTNVLYICVNGNWRSLCPSLWGLAQATVACRELNPGRTVISEFNFCVIN